MYIKCQIYKFALFNNRQLLDVMSHISDSSYITYHRFNNNLLSVSNASLIHRFRHPHNNRTISPQTRRKIAVDAKCIAERIRGDC